jgi:hypothetical protein
MNEDQVREQVRAAIARGDYDGALAALVPPPVQRRSLFELVEEDRGLLEIDERVVTRLVAEKMVALFTDVTAEVEQHVTTAINRARGRAD